MHVRANLVPTIGNRKGKRDIPVATKFAIVNMVDAGMRQIDVANHFGVSRSAVCMIVKNSSTSNSQEKKEVESTS